MTQRTKVYVGRREPNPHVYLRRVAHTREGRIGGEVALPPVGPTRHGFDWGNHSPATAALARAILANVISYAPVDCDAFADEVLVKLPLDGFELTEEEVVEWVGQHYPGVPEPLYPADLMTYESLIGVPL